MATTSPPLPEKAKVNLKLPLESFPEFQDEYRPVPLRLWFLGILLLYISSLCFLLEFTMSKLPQVNSRRDTASDNKQPNALNDTFKASVLTPTRPSATGNVRRSSVLNFPRNSNETNSHGTGSSLGNQTWIPSGNLSWALPDGATPNQLHPPPDQYANREANKGILNYRPHTVWIHGEDGSSVLPVFPGMDVSDRCVWESLNLYWTNDPNDCRALVDPVTGLDVLGKVQFNLKMPKPEWYYSFTPLRETERCILQADEYMQSENKGDIMFELPYSGCSLEEKMAKTALRFPRRSAEAPSVAFEWLITTFLPTLTTLPPTTSTIITVVTNQEGKTTTSVLTTAIPARAITTSVRVTTLVTTRPFIDMVDGTVITQTDSLGRPTATITSLASGTIPKRTTTVFDAQGHPIATQTLDETLLATTATFYDPDTGEATATSTRYFVPAPTPQLGPSSMVTVSSLSRFSYFAASFLPVLLTTLLTIPIQILNRTLRATAPFTALCHSSNGAPYKTSLGLKTEGSLINDPFSAIRIVFRFKQPLLLMSDLLVVLSMVLTSLASEGVGATLEGECLEQSFIGCWMSLAVVKTPARAAEAMLVAMGVLVMGIVILSGRWRVGVKGDPRSLANVAGLLAGENGRVRDLMRMVEVEKMKEELKAYRFRTEMAEVAAVKADDPVGATKRWKGVQWASTRIRHRRRDDKKRWYGSGKLFLEHGSRVLLLAVLSAILTIVVYYGSEQRSPRDPLERFMNGQTAGVAFLFTAAGTFIDLFWDHLYARCEMLGPYRRLSGSRPVSSAELIRLRSSNIFSGSFRAAKQGDWIVVAVAFAGLLAKCLPLLLSNIPHRLTLTWTTFVACTWMSVSCMSVMILILLVLFSVKQPHMPVDPGTLAGQMYYVCDSRMLMDFQGFANMDASTQARYMAKLGSKYRFGTMVGVTGKRRVGVDYLG